MPAKAKAPAQLIARLNLSTAHAALVTACLITARVAPCGGRLFLESARLVSAGAWALFAGVAIATLDNFFVVAHAGCTFRPASREAA